MRSAALRTAARAALMAGLAVVTSGATKAPIDYVVRGEGVVPATVGGVATRVRISPWAPAAPTLNPDFADRIGLHGGLFGFAVKVGTVKVKGQTSVTKFQFGTAAFKRRVVWFERPYVRGADLAFGPGGLPVDIVRFQLRAPIAGERTIALPLVQKLFQPTYARIKLADRDVTVLFDPAHERTLATAGAGQAIADSLGGQLTGDAGQAEIAFGINRPIRLMRMKSPLVIGPLSMNAIALRISDNGSTGGIPDADADPDEIVVTGKKSGDRRDVIIVGNDQLQHCSSIVFDKRAKQIRLTCA